MATNTNARAADPGAEHKTEAAGIVAQALNPAESLRLVELEQTISTGIRTFIKVGLALQEIRDARLYRDLYSTFEEYCKTRWGWTRQHANRVIGAAGVALDLEPVGSTLPERALRPLVKLAPEERKTILVNAKVLAGDKPVTSTHVKAAIEKTEDKFIQAIAADNRRGLLEERREVWEDGVVVGAEAALSALREHPDFETLAEKVISHVLGELFASKNRNRETIERDLRSYAKRGAIVSPTDAHPAPPENPPKAPKRSRPRNGRRQDAPGRDARRRPIPEGGGVCTTYGESKSEAKSDDDVIAGANAILAGVFGS